MESHNTKINIQEHEREFAFIEASIGCGGSIAGCEFAPAVIKKALPHFKWTSRVECMSTAKKWDALDDITNFSKKLAQQVLHNLSNGNKVCVVGGDHSCGIGTWSGLSTFTEVGVMWIDAHLDAHTHESSDSQNIHGMPLASLLGYGDEYLTKILDKKPKLKAENVCIIGARSYEKAEYELLKKLNVRIYFADEVKQRGLQNVLHEAHSAITKNVSAYGISFDLDFLNPDEMKCVGTPVDGGFSVEEALSALDKLPKEKLKVFELVEFNPNIGYDEAVMNTINKIILHGIGTK